MKILPVILNAEKKVSESMRTTYTRLSAVRKNSEDIALRASSIYKSEDKLSEYKRAIKLKKVLKEITPYNLPLVGAAVGFFSPIPGASVVLFAAGGIAGAGMILYNKFKPHKDSLKKSVNSVV